MNYPLNKNGIAKLEKMMKARVFRTQEELAWYAINYLQNFGYHAVWDSGPARKNGPGWSFYYAANWNYCIGAIDKHTIKPERDENEVYGAFKHELEAKDAELLSNFSFVKTNDENASDLFGATVYVTNSVYYGRWLNDGGYGEEKSHPNRFIELCNSYLHRLIHNIVRNARKTR